MSKFKKSIIIMIVISILIILASITTGLSFWRSNMAMAVDTTQQYMLGEADITNQINYQIVTNTYLTGFIMIVFGSLLGVYVDAALWVIYGAVLGIIQIIKKAKLKKKAKTND